VVANLLDVGLLTRC